MKRYALAVDIGASSGRLILGHKEDGELVLQEVYRFSNGIKRIGRHACWDTAAILSSIIEGMRRCYELGCIPCTVAIDTWGVDYVLLDAHGAQISEAIAYRDNRTAGYAERLAKSMPEAVRYARTGTACQSYNTVYQLMAAFEESPDLRHDAAQLLFMPCYLSYCLCGVAKNEYTIASTSALLNPATGQWDGEVAAAAQLPLNLLGEVPIRPGACLGSLRKEIVRQIGYDCQVIAGAGHDTACAFYAASHSRAAHTACLSSGTWSLFGAVLPAPIVSEAAMAAGFTNEGGVNGVRFLKNITGLWILQEIRREWKERLSFAEMAELAISGAAYGGAFDAADARFLHPKSMVSEILCELREQNAVLPKNDAELLYCVNHSLALCYATALAELQALTGQTFDSIHIVGGGSQNKLLNRLTEEAAQIAVRVGPIEATAMGNVMIQLEACQQ